jgi:tRNA (guanine-N7-)-methyltransferase
VTRLTNVVKVGSPLCRTDIEQGAKSAANAVSSLLGHDGAAIVFAMARLRNASRLTRDRRGFELANAMILGQDAELFAVDPVKLFGCESCLEVELGAGRGDFIIERASSMPERNFLAVDISYPMSLMVALRAARRKLTNLKIARLDARTLVNLLLPDSCVDAYHVYFPDPWPKARQSKHRLFTPYFASSLGRTLRSQGMVHVATDVAGYAEEIFAIFMRAGFVRTSADVPGRSLTGYGRKFLAAGREVFATAFVKPQGSEIMMVDGLADRPLRA